MTTGYSIANADETELAGPGRAIRFMRRQLGAEAFGVNWFELPPNGQGLEHDEADTNQEEVMIVIKGSGSWRIDGEEIPVRAGTFVRFDPATTRRAVAGPDGMTFIAIGAPRGSYRPQGPF